MSQLKRILLGDYYSAARDISRIFFCLVAVGRPRKKNNRTPAERRNNGNSLFFLFFFRLKRNLNIKLVITGDDNNAGSQSAAVIGF